MEKYYKMRSRFLGENHHFIRQINIFTKEVTKELISRKFCEHDRVSQYFSTLWLNELHKRVDLTKYFLVRENFLNFYTVRHLLRPQVVLTFKWKRRNLFCREVFYLFWYCILNSMNPNSRNHRYLLVENYVM